MMLMPTLSRASSTACACRSWWGANRRRTPAATASCRSSARAAVAAQRRPRVWPSITQNSGPGGQQLSVRLPVSELLKAELVHPGLAALVALAVTDQQRAAALVDVGLIQRERLGD